jgi:hypothetical protein
VLIVWFSVALVRVFVGDGVVLVLFLFVFMGVFWFFVGFFVVCYVLLGGFGWFL